MAWCRGRERDPVGEHHSHRGRETAFDYTLHPTHTAVLGMHDFFVVSCRDELGLHTKNNLVANVYPFAR